MPDTGETSHAQPQPSVDGDFRDNCQHLALQMRKLRLFETLVLRSPCWDMVGQDLEEGSISLPAKARLGCPVPRHRRWGRRPVSEGIDSYNTV